MKATELLREQHREIERLFQRVQAAEDEAEKAAAFRELAALVAAHTVIETEIFYPAAMEAHILTDEVREAEEEHAAIDFTLYRLFQVQPEDETFQARVMVLEELFTRHVEDREETLLSQVETSMGDKRLEELGEQLKARTQILQRKGNVQALLAQRIGSEIARRPARRAGTTARTTARAAQEKPARRAPVKAKQPPARKAAAKRAARANPRSERASSANKTTRSRKAVRSSR